MSINIEQEKFERMLRQKFKGLSLVQTEGISLEETKGKILEIFRKVKDSGVDHDLEMNYVSAFFHDWLTKEKKISEARATDLCLPLYELMMKSSAENLKKRLGIKEIADEINPEAKIIPFPGKIK
jgi:hypothetical protein